ncbi:MAG: exodeoxyribonuclease VII small subunit [Candidatus Magasanikbacteria bacterium GW2011_GWA2_45_39]|uniref:Exodeoxyribonuclease 7 small subunit n=1 Tax=Candidatus Magasanikbacteria bacterium GW2011_GWA2_45_39 TaxID=1619041 RepID=A0A0G1MI71_9BACT|nr:MAG: exodeoxyribonuclease VII small subunit [Candidatus Magasanikbacteria bacterium GW2011_GWA2_45_39]HBW74160.1 exodeoxyribonuclease VII small subunit [Candidatus Magasanikbacteria bacterium]
MAKEAKKIHFAHEFKELEAITEWFEKEDLDLEEGLKKFERGLELASSLKEYLGKVENKVKEIKAKFAASDEPEEDTDAPFK